MKIFRSVFIVFLLLSGTVAAESPRLGCDIVKPSVGPYDYTRYDKETRKMVSLIEYNHFNSNVETLTKGQTGYDIMGDLDFVLRHIPNHHRALFSMAKYRLRYKDKLDDFSQAECYFERAIRFSPRDVIVRQVYATYLHRAGKLGKAEEKYKEVLKASPNASEVHYNLGLLYFNQGKHDLALSHGRQAYELKYPLQGLKKMLKNAGVWDREVSTTQ